ncbi:MAG: sodium:proton antiporter NhaD [Bacteroidales bacterium]|jgi:Na+/H+ antiporter NhaD/arsenite permease-like protein|nr:sodium:proton antiporter NhaD [Bacteroidales bacterium]
MNAVFIAIIIVFIGGYACIALEHPFKVNKSASALILGVVLWTLIMIGGTATVINPDMQAALTGGSSFTDWLLENLLHQLGGIAEILFFLMGAMTIVELIDSYGGFKIITDKIATTSRVKFLWLLTILTFFMSSVLDNMTTAIVMVALLRKLVADQKERWFFAGMIILAANAGGAWSPIGDVTTIMLWVSGKVSTLTIMYKTFLASMMSIIVPLIILSFRMKGTFKRTQLSDNQLSENAQNRISHKEQVLILCLGVGVLLFVPIFKATTHLPPYIGMMGGLGILWVITEILKRRHPQRDNSRLEITSVLSRIDIPSILFFLGILLAVAALQVCGHLSTLSQSLNHLPLEEPGKYLSISYIIGLLSAVIDNVPLVAGAMGMYTFPADHYFWEFVAYCAGTGGSILIIGSAAGVAAMGLEKIDFIWYLKKISLLAFIGYTAGALTYIAQYFIMNGI